MKGKVTGYQGELNGVMNGRRYAWTWQIINSCAGYHHGLPYSRPRPSHSLNLRPPSNPPMPGGEAHSDYIALPSEGPGELYLEDEDGPFNSRKPTTCESQAPHSSIQVDLTTTHS